MKRNAKYFFLLTLLVGCATKEPLYPRVDSDLKNFNRKIADMRQDFAQIPEDPRNTEWVKKKLAQMFKLDQYMRVTGMNIPHRQSYSKDEEKYFWEQFAKPAQDVDVKNQEDLKSLLANYEWFTISRFGKAGDNCGWLIAQHADNDHAFQRHILSILEKLYPKKETSGQSYAYLYDRVQSGENLPQRYGTQGRCVGPGAWEAYPSEDPEKVDIRRAEVGLQSMAEYKKVFRNICH